VDDLARRLLRRRPAAEDGDGAVALMRPRLVVPIHWGTFAPIGSGGRRLEPASDPAWAFVAHVAERAPSVVVRVLAPGESVALADA
jgi:L-ascorbate metabolism protein UlaG (beta-lactamase superfamily)